MSDIKPTKSIQAITIQAEVVVPCNERQAKLLTQDPSKAFVAPKGSVIRKAVILETEVMDDMPKAAFIETIKRRTHE